MTASDGQHPVKGAEFSPLMTTARDVWRWALWFGVLSGLGQALILAIIRLTTNRIIFVGPEVVWMAPAVNTVVFAVVAVGLQLTTFRLERSAAAAAALAVFLFLLVLGPLLVVPRLHPYAKVMLGVGLAVQGSRLIRSRAALLDATIRRTLPWLVGLCVALGLGLPLSREVVARRAEASLPAAAPGTPNVILIVLDSVRAQSLSLYGYQRPTSPRLDEFAKTGVVFERALATSPWTLPSHGSMFTGRLPHELSADWLTPLDAEHPTLAEAFASRGYMTVGVTANLVYTSRGAGLNRGFVRYADHPALPGAGVEYSWLARALVEPLARFAGRTDNLARKRASDVNDQFLAWIASRPNKPFFAFLNYFDAHAPYMPPAPFDTQFSAGGPLPDLRVERTWSPQEIQRLMDAYDGALAYLDAQLGTLLDTLKSQGVLDNTLVVVTSDHGEQFGEHGLVDHANSLYRPLLHVPLLMVFPPRVPSALRVSEPVTLVNLPATILDLADVSAASGFPGDSLAEFWHSSERPSRRPIVSEVSGGINLPAFQPLSRGPMQSVVVGGMHYIRNGDGREELYDFEHDVAETENLVGHAETSAVLDAARRALAAALTRR